ncbi:tRNA (uracil-5-)-methyltransferase homolog B-like [Penaeus vannamei]|uniref:tRNA (uracil-5-)-methyltransferase homolog B-like n=1 Tax=Penaeus vannamei TaxID=6689 RepID=UPI00387F8823
MSVFTARYLPILFFTRGLRRQPASIAKVRKEASKNEVVLPLSEETLQTLAKQTTTQNERPPPPKVKSKPTPLKQLIVTGSLTEPITETNQHEKLAQAVTPLYQISYHKQLNLKAQEMKQALKVLKRRLTDVRAPLHQTFQGLPCHFEPVRPSPEVLAYRNKDEFGIHFGVDGNPKTVGFFVGRPTDPLMTCVPPTFLINMRDSHKQIAESFQNFIRQSSHEACHRFDTGGVWRNLVVRSTQSGEKMATVIVHPQQLGEDGIQEIMEDLRKYYFEGEGSECELDSLYLQACQHTRCTREQAPYRLVGGQKYITETCQGLKFQISPDSFFQVNTKGAETLYNTVKEIAEVSPITTLLDICCGTGTISLVMAPHVRGAVGIEVVTGAVEDARSNAKENKVENASFLAGKAEKVLPRIISELSDCTDVVAIVNPARAGLHPDVIRGIRQCEAINKLVYISCKPEGFAMENFVKLGSTRGIASKRDKTAPFTPRYAVPVDLFPHTSHTELVILFERVYGS